MKKFKKIKKRKIWLSSLLVVVTFTFAWISASTFITIVNLPNYDLLSDKIKFVGSKKQNYNYNDALKNDVIQKAHSKSVLLYFINWHATFHKLGSASHLIKILELNPEKEIYFIIRSDVAMDLSAIINNKKYPNFNFIIINKGLNVSNINSLVNFNFFPPEIEDVVNSIITKNKEIDFYSDDFFIFKTIELLLQNIKQLYYNSLLKINIIKNIYNCFNKLEKMKSINMFSDGTLSVYFYSKLFYENFLFIGNKIANEKYVSENFSWSNNNQTIDNLMMFMYSLIVTNKKGNDQQKTKYFLATTELVNEVNEKTTAILETKCNDFFDPYNSLEADIISFCKTFNNDSQIILNSIFSKTIFNPSDYEFMDNNYNFVYSGRKLTYENLDSEVRKLLNIKQEIEKKGIKNYNVIFKGHPRDSDKDTLQKKLRSKINEFDNSDDGSWLFTIEPKIPYEIYLTNGTFSNNIEKNKVVLLYTTFSTINLFLYAEDQNLKMIEKILLNETEVGEIKFMFGENSKIFPKEKWDKQF